MRAPGAREVAQRHAGQRRLADARRAAEQHERAGHEAAAEHAVELADPGRQPRDAAAGWTSRSATARAARPRRAAPPRAGAAAAARAGARSSTSVFHSPQPGHWPCQRASAWPQAEQTWMVDGRAMGVTETRVGTRRLRPPGSPPGSARRPRPPAPKAATIEACGKASATVQQKSAKAKKPVSIPRSSRSVASAPQLGVGEGGQDAGDDRRRRQQAAEARAEPRGGGGEREHHRGGAGGAHGQVPGRRRGGDGRRPRSTATAAPRARATKLAKATRERRASPRA